MFVRIAERPADERGHTRKRESRRAHLGDPARFGSSVRRCQIAIDSPEGAQVLDRYNLIAPDREVERGLFLDALRRGVPQPDPHYTVAVLKWKLRTVRLIQELENTGAGRKRKCHRNAANDS